MESQETNVAATATGAPSAGVVTAGKAEGSLLESTAIDPEIIAAIIRDIRDPELTAMVREFATPDVNCPRPDTTVAETAIEFMNLEAVMIRAFSDAKKAIAEGKSNFQMCDRTESGRAMSGLAEDSPEGSTENLEVEKALSSLAGCVSDDLQEIEERMIILFSSVKETIERAKAVAFEETVAAAAPTKEIPENFHDLIRTFVCKLRNENSFDRAHFALTLFVRIILRQNMQLLRTDAGEGHPKRD